MEKNEWKYRKPEEGNVAEKRKGQKRNARRERTWKTKNRETAMKPEGIAQSRKEINRVAASTGNENGKARKGSKTRDLINILIVRRHERNVATV